MTGLLAGPHLDDPPTRLWEGGGGPPPAPGQVGSQVGAPVCRIPSPLK